MFTRQQYAISYINTSSVVPIDSSLMTIPIVTIVLIPQHMELLLYFPNISLESHVAIAYFDNHHINIILVQLSKFKIILVAACFFVVEGVDAHVDFLEFLGTVVEWGGGVLLGGYRHYHVGG